MVPQQSFQVLRQKNSQESAIAATFILFRKMTELTWNRSTRCKAYKFQMVPQKRF